MWGGKKKREEKQIERKNEKNEGKKIKIKYIYIGNQR